MSGPLDWKDGNAECECDVIFAAAVLGFTLTRVVLDQSFTFDMANPKSFPNLDDAVREFAGLHQAVRAVTQMIEESGFGNASVVVGASVGPEYKGLDQNLVVGLPGGERLHPKQRLRAMRDLFAQAMGEWEYKSALPEGVYSCGQYHGNGAYTGMIDDQIGHHTLIQPTLRRVICDPYRWNPNPAGIWGLIGTDNMGGEFGDNLSSDIRLGMGTLRRHCGIVQYVHGMSWAMREAIRWGPWVTAYEMAVGEKTQKLSSCFACTTYMWATGYPASSTHLGRGASWGVLPDGTLGEGEDHEFSGGKEGENEKAIAGSMNVRWKSHMFHFVAQGTKLLEKHKPAMSPGHRIAADLLTQHVQMWGNADLASAGNLFLDAMTYHKNDTKRLLDTLCPGY